MYAWVNFTKLYTARAYVIVLAENSFSLQYSEIGTSVSQVSFPQGRRVFFFLS